MSAAAVERSAGSAVRVLRTAMGMTLRELAARAGTSSSYISQVERGDRIPSPAWVAQVSGSLAGHLTHVARGRARVRD